jgi:hypothetical protein
MNICFLSLFVLLLVAAQSRPPLTHVASDDLRQDTTPVAITSPGPNEILRGQVQITGKVDTPSFVSIQLDFAYAPNPTNTWFNIQTFSELPTDSTLTTWDTTSITDGDYVLRLKVNFEDGSSQEATVPVKVGNDFVPTPTPKPTSTPQEDTVLIPTPFLLAASPTPTEVPRATPTALPPNPVSLGQNQIYTSLERGALVILGLFALAGIIVRVRRY